PSTATVVDVGGGDGMFLARLLLTYPHLRGILFDLPGPVPLAAERFAAAGVADRCELRSGDFFEEVPSNGDVYLLSHILHDWNDERASQILRACARAMDRNARLMVIDLVVSEDGSLDPGYRTATLLDLYMLSL